MANRFPLPEKTDFGPPSGEDARRLAEELSCLTQTRVYPSSITVTGGATFFLCKRYTCKLLGILFTTDGVAATNFTGEEQLVRLNRQGLVLKLCPADHLNADALRQTLPYIKPRLIGLRRSVGFGDRLGLATPGHIRAARHASGIAPILAQQSMRENARTGRTPQQVLDDAAWGVFQEGWREPWGADADHLKTLEDVDLCVAAGYTFYTADPGAHVDNAAHDASPDVLKDKIQALPWDDLEDSPNRLHARYLGHRFHAEGFALEFNEMTLARGAAKYGRAIAHTVCMYRHLASQTREFELEISVDETETPTSPEEHFFVASEFKRLGVHWVSLAPRYVGRFEKGVDYIGDLDTFEAEFARHAAIARTLGPYKLSLHSGSDKFGIYPIVARHADGLVHLKTAGTSYLEVLRVIGAVDPLLFREILTFARQRYGEDKATYHVSADPVRVPSPDKLADYQQARVLDLFDGREVLHVTFGSVLDRFGERLKAVLAEHEETYYAALEEHLKKHLAPFA